MKTISKILLIAVMSFFILGSLNAQEVTKSDGDKSVQKTATATSVTPGEFIDTNNDGICDNAAIRGKTGKGRNFVDKDGDGTCDNFKSVKCNGNQGCCGYNKNKCGKGHGLRHRDGSCIRNAGDKNTGQPKTK